MTDTNNKETFESEFAIREQAILMTIEKNLNIKDKRAREANNFLSNMKDTLFKFKQLHDKSIQEVRKEYTDNSSTIEILKLAECIDDVDDDVSNKCIELIKRGKISASDLMEFCQTFKNETKKKDEEIERLKDFIYCKENLRHISCGEERIHFSKQNILRLKKELNNISETELNELNEFEKINSYKE